MIEEQYLNRIEDLENKLAIVMQYRVEKDLLKHIVELRERMDDAEKMDVDILKLVVQLTMRVEALEQSHV